ncbi:MAG: C4-dicarboxylic acid transporter DauA [Gammaproteobacteria bacterium]|nr:C4-dicarboxylic acid transporter DauA [Gammaproteobacteria bacterium]
MYQAALIASAVRESWRTGYSLHTLRRDAIAGLTVGIIAIPLAMALAIASGVPPQHGLYTAMIAGALIALTGGSRFNVSGPTAAFVVILLPVTQKFGIGGLLLATAMAGLILVVMGIARMGQLIRFIPYPVTTGFTAGIAVVIAALQLRDFLGLDMPRPEGHFVEMMLTIFSALPSAHWPDALIAVLTIAVLILWPRLKLPVPGHLVALVLATLTAWLCGQWLDDFSVATIGSRFEYMMDGVRGAGIPPSLPGFSLPWLMAGADGQPLHLSLHLFQELIGPAFAIALLGAIESLLCAVVADGLTATRHNPNAELVGQGIGNIVAPFFGGITATAAIARTATSIRTGAHSPVAAVVHALVILLIIQFFSGWLSYVPMAALAGFLMMVAWNIGEAKHFGHIVRVAPRSDVLVLLVCFTLTVVFDMVIAVGVGVVLAALLFIRRMSELTGTELITEGSDHQHANLPSHVAVYDINGPLFFGAAEKAMGVLLRVRGDIRAIVLDMKDVPMIDMTGTVALETLLSRLHRQGVLVLLSNLSPRLEQALVQTGIAPRENDLLFCPDVATACQRAIELRPK